MVGARTTTLGARIYAGLFKVYGQAQISAADAPTSAYPDIVQGRIDDWQVRHAADGSTYLVSREDLDEDAPPHE